MSAAAWVGLALLGSVAAVARAVAPGRTTVGVNLVGSFALGVLVGVGASPTLLFLLGTGVLSTFTTFSTWMLEVSARWQAGRRGTAAIHLAGPLLAGLLCVWLGRVVGRAVA